MNKLVKISAAIISSVAFVGATQAATPGAYAGIGLGYSQLSTPSAARNANSNTFLFSPTSTSSKSGGLGGRLFGGYNFNKYFGLEAAYAAYAGSQSKASSTGSIGSVFSNTGTGSQKVSEDALSLVGKAYLPIQETGFNVYALGGVAEVFAKNRYNSTYTATLLGNTGSIATSSSYKTRALRPTYGLGVSYDINTHLTTNLEYSRIQGRGNLNTNNHAIANANLVTLNLGYNFG